MTSASSGISSNVPGWVPPLVALQFLTRMPIPPLCALSDEQARAALQRAVPWFPLAGSLVGAVTAITLFAAGQLWPAEIAVVLALVVDARLTGALHEDAVADFCDALGGGRDPQHVRAILKDSRVGSYGALGLALLVLLRAALLFVVVTSFDFLAAAIVIVASATFGRWLMVIVMASIPPAPGHEGLASRVGSNVGRPAVALATLAALPALIPFAWLAPVELLAALIAAAAFLFWFGRLVKIKTEGLTGDCVGFSASAGQLIALLAACTGAGG